MPLPDGINAALEAMGEPDEAPRRGRRPSRREQPRGDKRASGNPPQKHRRGGDHSGKHEGNRSHRNGRANPRRERHDGGLDSATGLPAFLVRAPERQQPDRDTRSRDHQHPQGEVRA